MSTFRLCDVLRKAAPRFVNYVFHLSYRKSKFFRKWFKPYTVDQSPVQDPAVSVVEYPVINEHFQLVPR